MTITSRAMYLHHQMVETKNNCTSKGEITFCFYPDSGNYLLLLKPDDDSK